MSKAIELIDEILKKYEKELEKRDPKTHLPGILLDKANMDAKVTPAPTAPITPKAPELSNSPKLPAVAKGDEKGVHQPFGKPGESFAGATHREANVKKFPKDAVGRTEIIDHKEKLKELQNMPKPNLPKSEQEDKKLELAKNLKKCLTAKVEKAKLEKWGDPAKVPAIAKADEKGVHQPLNPKHVEKLPHADDIKPLANKGSSVAGFMVSIGNKYPARGNKEFHNRNAKNIHQDKLKELKQMPKPNLPKSEQEDKKLELAKNLKKALKK